MGELDKWQIPPRGTTVLDRQDESSADRTPTDRRKPIESHSRFFLGYNLLQYPYRVLPYATPGTCKQRRLKSPRLVHLVQSFELQSVP